MTIEEQKKLIEYCESHFFLVDYDGNHEKIMEKELIALAKDGLSMRILTQIYGEPEKFRIQRLAEWAEKVALVNLELIHNGGVSNGESADVTERMLAMCDLAKNALKDYPR